MFEAKGPPEESALRAAELLRGLLPGVPDSEIAEASLKVAPLCSVQEHLKQTADHLGTRVYEVDASARELSTTSGGLPALRMTGEAEVISKLASGKLQAAGAHGKRILAPEELETHGSFWVLSPSLQLRALANKSPIARLRAYLREEKDLVQLIFAYAVFVELLALAAPLTVQVLINTIGFGMLTQPLFVLSFLLLVALAGAATLRLLQTYAVEKLSRRFVKRVVMDLGERLYRMSNRGPRFPEHRFFEIASVDKALFVICLDLMALVLQVVAATLLLAVYHPLLLGFAVLMGLAIGAAILMPFPVAIRRSIAESDAKYGLGRWLGEHDGSMLKQQELMDRWLESRHGTFRVTFGQQLVLFAVQVVFSAGLLLMGGRLVIEGQLTLGQLVAAELVTTAALVSLGKLGKELATVYSLITSLEKLGRLVDLPTDGPFVTTPPYPPKSEAA